MTMLEARPDTRQIRSAPAVRPVRRPGARRRSPSSRPEAPPLRYRTTGVLTSRASHRRRPITPLGTVGLALIAAGITVWLGLVAHVGGVVSPTGPTPDRLAVVRVQSGETLQHVAERVAPDAPVGDVVQRIRELNELHTGTLDAGQTLIAPVG